MLSSAAVTYATAPFKRPGMDIELGGRVGIFTAEYRQYQEIYDKLEEILLPLKKSFSRQEKRLLLKNGGKIDFWVTNDNKLAGRGREYEIILIDEAAFTKSPEMLREIWPKSIKPTLLTTKGRAYVFSTPDGVDEENFFYAICHDKTLALLSITRQRPPTRSFRRKNWRRRGPTTTRAYFAVSSWPSSSTGLPLRCSTSANGSRVRIRISLSITLKCAGRLRCHGHRRQRWIRA